MQRLSFKWTLALLAIAGLQACSSKKSESSKTSFEVVPEKPIVITADTLKNGTAIAWPWFKFYLNFTNNTDKPITLLAITGQIYPPNTTTPITFSADPAGESFTVGDVLCAYTTFGTYQPGETRPIELASGIDTCKQKPYYFYVGGLPKPKGNSFTYRAKFKPLGWFGTETVPTDRFETQFQFTTQ